MLLCLGQCAAGNGHRMYGLKIGGLVRDPLLESESNISTLNPPLKTLIQTYPIHTHTHILVALIEKKHKKATEKVRMGKAQE